MVVDGGFTDRDNIAAYAEQKAGLELVWTSLTYNVMQWIRLCWRRPVGLATA